jgi:hypothetical protein
MSASRHGHDAGRDVIIQAWDFRPGSDFVVRMHGALMECDHVVAVLSHAYLLSAYATSEWAAAMGRTRRGRSVV